MLLRMRGLRHDALVLAVLLCLGFGLTTAALHGARQRIFPLDTPQAMLPTSGLHEIERSDDHPQPFRWTGGDATVKLPNPGGPLQLQVELTGGPRGNQPVLIVVGDATLAFEISAETRVYHLAVPPQFGDRVTLALQSSTEQLANRTLGVVLGTVGIAGGGSPSPSLVLAILAATVGVFMLLRSAAFPWWQAAAVIAGLQVLALAWQYAGGWSYGLGMLLLLGGAVGAGTALVVRWLPALPAPAEPRWPRFAQRDWLVVGGVLLLGLLVRLPWVFAPDPVGDLELSARRLGQLNLLGLAGSFTSAGDYMPLRLYWLRAMALAAAPSGVFDPLNEAALYPLIKLPGLLSDLATAVLMFAWARRWHTLWPAAGLVLLYVLAPPVWANVAWWGQIDSVLMLPLLLMLTLLGWRGGLPAWALWAVALLIKPQAIVFAPVLYAATLRLHGSRGVAFGGGLAVAFVALGMAPLALIGQGPGMLEAYFGSVGRFAQLTSRAYNLWYLATGGASGPDVGQGFGLLSFREIGMLLLAAVVACCVLALFRRADGPTRVLSAAVIALAFFTLPTQIHERYLFLGLPCFALAAFSDKRVLPGYLLLVASATVNILGALSGFVPALTPIIQRSPLPLLLSAFHILLLVVVLWYLLAGRRRLQPAADML